MLSYLEVLQQIKEARGAGTRTKLGELEGQAGELSKVMSYDMY
jgi:hypothetical protein